MAILKHIASKNADYGEIQRYLMFEHDEDTNKPILDENGELIPRKEYIMDGINCDPFTFDMECRELFQNLLLEKYNVKLKVSRDRFSYLHPERGKYITGRMLGTHYEEDYLLELFKENAERKENKKKTVDVEKCNMETGQSAASPSKLLQEEAVSVLFIKSDLRLVVDLQACVKAQQNASYA